MTEHEKDIACVFNDLRECIAKTPEACLCNQMPFKVYVEKVKNFLARSLIEGL